MTRVLIAFLLFAGNLKLELSSLVEAERAFAKMSVDKGMREAFLANLSDESIIFRPGAVRGKAWFTERPPSSGQLSWAPEFADIAKSADLGYTTGPYEARATGQEPGFGHYVTVWKKQAGGGWKIAIDYGIAHASGAKPSSVASPGISDAIENARSAKEIASARAALEELEKRFPTAIPAYSTMLSSEARLYRDGSFPFTGSANVRAALAKQQGTFKWQMQDAGVSSACDLGYSYGTVEFTPSDRSKEVVKGNFVRIWKKERSGEWKVVLDVVN